MGFYKLREDYAAGLSEMHPWVAHNQPVSIDDDTPRKSFFRINDEEELQAACRYWSHLPCVAMHALDGGLLNKDGSIRQLNINTWWFLDKMILDAANPIESTAITIAYDRSFQVMQDYIRKIIDDYEENPGCGTFYDIDPGKFKWRQVGPIEGVLYGWELTFTDETRPFFNTISMTPDEEATRVLPYTYKATGTEGNSVTIPRLQGREIILISRENSLLTVVEEAPGLREVQRIGVTSVFTFPVDLAKDEILKFIYE